MPGRDKFEDKNMDIGAWLVPVELQLLFKIMFILGFDFLVLKHFGLPFIIHAYL